jgi:hypothetical protein
VTPNYLLHLIPNTFNSKNNAQVIPVNSNFGIAIPDKILLTEFNLYLAQLPRDKQRKKKYSKKVQYLGSNWGNS